LGWFNGRKNSPQVVVVVVVIVVVVVVVVVLIWVKAELLYRN